MVQFVGHGASPRNNSTASAIERLMGGFEQGRLEKQELEKLAEQAASQKQMKEYEAAQSMQRDRQSFENELEKQRQRYQLERENEEFKQKNIPAKPKSKEEFGREDKINSLELGLDTISQMRALGKKGNLGRGSSILGLFGGETSKDRGQYEQLGKSLISLASTIPIRNQKEFEVLSNRLFDSSLPDKEREGILDAMESIISRSLKPYGKQESNKTIEMMDAQGNTYDIPEHLRVQAKKQGLLG